MPARTTPSPALSRRRFLRGAAGTALALPCLESLEAAGTAAPPVRVAFYYVPTGVLLDEFFPGRATDPARMRSSPHAHLASRTLEPLEPVADKVTLVTGLDRIWRNTSDQHEQCGSCFLSSIDPRLPGGSRMPQGRTLDHVIAAAVGGDTPFRTLEFSGNTHRDHKESIHYDTISWYGPDHAAPSMRDPQLAYRRLFAGAATAPTARVTDLVLADARSLALELGAADRRKLGEYLESIRSIEVQMDRLAALRGELERMRLPEPAAAHLPRGEHLRLMGDLLVAALQSGLTNVATFMAAPERWDTGFLFEGISGTPLSHHLLSHVGWSEELRQIDRFYMAAFAALLEKMDAIREADGSTLLDNTILTYGSGLSNGAAHDVSDLPIVVAGRGGGRIASGRQIRCPPGTPLANLWLAQAAAVGLDLDSFADGTGVLPGVLVS